MKTSVLKALFAVVTLLVVTHTASAATAKLSPFYSSPEQGASGTATTQYLGRIRVYDPWADGGYYVIYKYAVSMSCQGLTPGATYHAYVDDNEYGEYYLGEFVADEFGRGGFEDRNVGSFGRKLRFFWVENDAGEPVLGGG